MHIDNLFSVFTAIVTLCSTVASAINHVVRSKQNAGEPVAPALLGAGTLLNVGAVNLDKAVQLAKLLRGAKADAQGAADDAK